MKRPKHLKNIFISAIHQNAGKTTVALGLFKNFQERKIKTAFMKPVGQETVTFEEKPIDKDTYLIGEVYHCKKHIKDMSPITVGRGYTEKYILEPEKQQLQEKILKSFQTITRGKDAIIVEGTGHAGVGSVIDCSNADVAALLGARAIIISGGGIGRAIDEIMLNKALFDLCKVPLVGVIINKVRPEKLEKVKAIVGKGLSQKGIRLLGVIPEKELLSAPTVAQVKERLDLKVFSGEENLNSRVHDAIVAAMEPYNMIGHLRDGALVITSGDRVDNMLVAVSSYLLQEGRAVKVAGLILTGGLTPDHKIAGLLKDSRIPVLYCDQDTYTIAAAIENMTPKIQKTDRDKILEARRVVKDHVNVDMILENS
ncbi:MAG: AAA family ATPase [Candidatus Omnitrophica bacterium]|nr:AAA family ATPase [Candidatus Omnitrophota bacterium]MDE2009576.1 AAA family ATPase [Candidatus Omnitrophota bacterium]MDE2214620.1 AAA family ATPase [Candidatus Omnitrophota bacterium]MDE2232232.1 AAA family ATPase [Candidatus Omnitrophota bacterium]